MGFLALPERLPKNIYVFRIGFQGIQAVPDRVSKNIRVLPDRVPGSFRHYLTDSQRTLVAFLTGSVGLSGPTGQSPKEHGVLPDTFYELSDLS